jgi:outer membrane receptor protein involved in Fe transport
VQVQEVNTTNYTANITGDLFELPAGALAFAAGYEYRGTDGKFVPDSLIAEGGSSTNFTEPTTGNQKVDEFYGELSIPLLKDLAFAEILELSLAGRYSDYSSSGTVGLNQITSNIGDTTNFKVGFRWKPIADLLFRGNYAETFRAPSVADLYTGGLENFPSVNDPCRNALQGNPNQGIYQTLTADAQQRCVDQGVPVGGYNQSNQQIRTLGGGNPFLEPEVGDTRTLGLVYSPSWAEGLDLYLDWYNIQLENALSFFGGTTILNRCIVNNEPIFCGFIQRSPTGETTELRTSSFNAAALEVEGWDIGINYRLDTEWGKFRWSWNTAYISDYLFRADASSDEDDLVGETDGFDSGIWRIRSNLATNWSLGDWDATWNMRYFSPLEEPCFGSETDFEDGFTTVDFCDLYDGGNGNPSSANFMGSVTYHDFQVGWNAPWNGRIAGGVRNAFDKQPPPSYGAFANSTLQGYDLADSRFWYMSYSQKF